MNVQEVGPSPRLWDYEKYTEVHMDDDTILLEHPEAFIRFLKATLAKTPVVLFLGEK